MLQRFFMPIQKLQIIRRYGSMEEAQPHLAAWLDDFVGRGATQPLESATLTLSDLPADEQNDNWGSYWACTLTIVPRHQGFGPVTVTGRLKRHY